MFLNFVIKFENLNHGESTHLPAFFVDLKCFISFNLNLSNCFVIKT